MPGTHATGEGALRAARFEDLHVVGVLTASGIGDFVAAIPALERLRATYPMAEIDIIGDGWHPAILEDRPGPWSRAVTVPRTDGVCRLEEDLTSPLRRFVAEHRGGYDLIVQLHGGGAQSNEVVRALRPRHSVGSWTPGARELERTVCYVAGRSEVLRCLEVVELAGATMGPSVGLLAPELVVTERDQEEGRCAWPGEGHFMLIHPGARDVRRCWPAERFADVAAVLRRDLGLNVLVVGTSRDGDAARAVMRRLDGEAVDLTGRLSLGGLLGLAARCTVFVGNDSGPRHVAAAAGAPTVGLFLLGNLLTFGPLVGANHRAVVSSTECCPVCRRPGNDGCGHATSWVEEVLVDDVLDACHEVLDAAGRNGGNKPA